MNSYAIKLEIDNHFDTLNRVLNKFCGRGFDPQSIIMTANEDKKDAVVAITVKGHLGSIQLVLKKLAAFIDVHRVLAFEEVKKLNVS